jgi:hypothetical protein
MRAKKGTRNVEFDLLDDNGDNNDDDDEGEQRRW